jgi:hypothetical protein
MGNPDVPDPNAYLGVIMEVIVTDVTSRWHRNRYISIQRHNNASLLVLQQPNFSLTICNFRATAESDTVYSGGMASFILAQRTAGIFGLLQRFRDKLWDFCTVYRRLYLLHERPCRFQCPPSLLFRVPGFCPGWKATALTPVYLPRLKVSGAVPLLLPVCFHGVGRTQLYLLYLHSLHSYTVHQWYQTLYYPTNAHNVKT